MNDNTSEAQAKTTPNGPSLFFVFGAMFGFIAVMAVVLDFLVGVKDACIVAVCALAIGLILASDEVGAVLRRFRRGEN